MAKEVEKLVKQIKIAKEQYYYGLHNDIPDISDAEYDVLEARLRKLDSENPILKQVGAKLPKTVSQRKAELPYPLASLNKVRANDVDAWLNKNSGPYVVTEKVDGLSALFVNRNGKISVYTRGDATEGQDITHLLPYLRIGSMDGLEAVRGEIVMTNESFKKWSKEYKNARNLTAGICNSKEVHKAARDLVAIAYEVISPRFKPSNQMKLLKEFGWNCAKSEKFDSLSSKILTEQLNAIIPTLNHAIDGLVIERDRLNSIGTEENPKYKVAFKGINEAKETQVIAIDWHTSRYGALKPVLRVEPIELSGVTISQCTAYNAQYLKENSIGPGSIVKIIRSGEVIPKVVQVIKSTKVVWPKVPFTWNSVDIVLSKETAAKDHTVLAKQLCNFFSILDVEGFKKGTADKFVERGFLYPKDVIFASEKAIASLDGFALHSAKKLYESIQEQVYSASIAKMMAASGIFGKGFGLTRMELIVKKFPNPLQLLKISHSKAIPAIASIAGFSSVSASQFLESLPAFNTFITEIEYTPIIKTKKTGGYLEGASFVFSGVRNKNLETTITEKGGKVSGSVSSKTTALIVADPNGSSEKLTKARQLSVNIISLNDAISLYG